MNILVTGATGFIGSRFIELSVGQLRQEDQIILLTSKKIDGYKCILHKGYTFSTNDFKMEGIERIDKVIHIGHFMFENHKNESEVMGNISSINNTAYLLKHLPNIPDIFIYCSAMAVYGIHRTDMLDEKSRIQPDNPYGISKVMIEMLLQEWAHNNNVLLHILRLGHIYGPADKRSYTIPIWLQAKKKNQAIKLYTNPNMYRNCLYRDDCCAAMWKALELYEDIEIINVVSEHNATLLEIAELCKEISNNEMEIEIISNLTDQENRNGLRFKNNQLFKQYLCDEYYSLKEGLKIEFDYYEKI